MEENAAVDDKFLDENFEQIANNSNIPLWDQINLKSLLLNF